MGRLFAALAFFLAGIVLIAVGLLGEVNTGMVVGGGGCLLLGAALLPKES